MRIWYIWKLTAFLFQSISEKAVQSSLFCISLSCILALLHFFRSFLWWQRKTSQNPEPVTQIHSLWMYETVKVLRAPLGSVCPQSVVCLFPFSSVLCVFVPGQPTDPVAVLLAPCLDAYLKWQVLQSLDIQPRVLITLPLMHHAFRSSSFVLLRPHVLILPLAIFGLCLQTSSCSVPDLWFPSHTAQLGFLIRPPISSGVAGYLTGFMEPVSQSQPVLHD